MWKIWASAGGKVHNASMPCTSSNWLLLSNRDKRPTPTLAHIFHIHISRSLHNFPTYVRCNKDPLYRAPVDYCCKMISLKDHQTLNCIDGALSLFIVMPCFLMISFSLHWCFLKGLTMIFAGQENSFIIFRSKEIHIYFKTNIKIPINLLK